MVDHGADQFGDDQRPEIVLGAGVGECVGLVDEQHPAAGVDDAAQHGQHLGLRAADDVVHQITAADFDELFGGQNLRGAQQFSDDPRDGGLADAGRTFKDQVQGAVLNRQAFMARRLSARALDSRRAISSLTPAIPTNPASASAAAWLSASRGAQLPSARAYLRSPGSVAGSQ